MTSGIPHGRRVINKRLEEQGSEGETDPQSAARLFCFSAAECFIAQCAAPIFSSCRDYSNQASALKTSHLRLTKEGTDIPGPRGAIALASEFGGGQREQEERFLPSMSPCSALNKTLPHTPCHDGMSEESGGLGATR